MHERAWPVHRLTAFILVLVARMFLWLNLRPSGYQGMLGGSLPPEGLDPVTRALFYQGWPLSPCLTCLMHGMKFHPEEGGCQSALVLDGVLALLVLAAVGCACEWLMGRWRTAKPAP